MERNTERYYGNEVFIAFLKLRKKAGSTVTIIRRGKPGSGIRLYAKEEQPLGKVYRWYWNPTANAKAIAKELGVPYKEIKLHTTPD